MSNYNRVYNFSAGPSMLPVPVLERCSADMLNYQHSGMSVMEMSHRSSVFETILKDAQRLLREVMAIPENYKVIFMQGGASLQFSAIPLNLSKNKKADFVLTGNFSSLAAKEAAKFIDVNIAGSGESVKFTSIPTQSELNLSLDADYLHICFNNTIYGTKFSYIPDTKNIPLVADISSCILSETIDVSKFGVLYAGVQKNIAPAGMSIVIIREDLISENTENIPTMLHWKTIADGNSMFNTPNCWCIYLTKLVLEHIISIGGISQVEKNNIKKANILYEFLEESKLFSNTVKKEDRSIMNVIFKTGDSKLDALFVSQSDSAGLVNLKGHKVLGGMRASIYNNMPLDGVEALVEFMKEFEAKNS